MFEDKLEVKILSHAFDARTGEEIIPTFERKSDGEPMVVLTAAEQTH